MLKLRIILLLSLMLFCSFIFAAFAAEEIQFSDTPGLTFYFVRFDGDEVYLSDGSAKEIWGTAGRDADDYDVSMTESGSSGWFVGDFDPVPNIGAGIYKVVAFVQAGANPADGDQPGRWQGEIGWTGTAEDQRTFKSDIDALNDISPAEVNAEVDTALADYDGPTNAEMLAAHATTDTHLTDIKGTSFVKDTHSLIDIWTLADWLRDVLEADTWTNTATTPWRMEIREKGTVNKLIEKELFQPDGSNLTQEYQRIGQKTEP